MIKFSCKSCGEKLSVQDQFSGKRIKCPKCNNTSVVPAESPRIRFDCHNCGKGIRVLQIHAGKKGQCPKCKSPVVVPSLKGDPGEDSGTVTVVCSMCNETIRVPKGSKERFMECPACGSNVETSLRGEPVESDSSIPPDTDQDQYDEESDLPEEDDGPDRRLIFAICGAAVVVVVGLIVLVTVILPSGSGPVEEPDVSLRQQVADADSRPRPVASDTEPAGAFILEPPKQDAGPGEPVSSEDELNKQAKIAFWSMRDGNMEIYVMNSDGTEQRRLTNNRARDENPSLSPDGKKIAFASGRGGNMEIYVMNTDGTGQRNLTNNPAHEIPPFLSQDGKNITSASIREENPSWSPDGKKIAFGSMIHIYTMNADGSEVKRLGFASHADTSWSPDGKKIAFEWGGHIHAMNADGSEARILTDNLGQDADPSWSPDGKKIAFHSNRDTNYEIYIMNADGSEQRNLTNNPAHDLHPCWSQDGKKIVFVSERDGNREIYAMNPDGSEQRNLTNDPGYDCHPSCSPFLSSGPQSAEEPESRQERQEITDADVRPQPVASEQSAAARSSDLRLRLQPGQKRALRMVKEDKVVQTLMGQRQEISSAKTTELEFEVEDVDPNGMMRLKVTYLAIKEKGQGAGAPMQYDSTTPDVSTEYPFGPMYSAMIGQSFLAKVTPEGRMIGLEGVDQMYLAMAETIVQGEDDATRKRISERMTEGVEERVQKSIGRANERHGSRQKRIEAVADMLKKNPIIAAEQIAQMVGNLIMVYPGRAVEAGDSWQAKKALFSLGTVNVDCTYTLREKTPAVMVVGVSSRIELDNELVSAKGSSLGSARTTLTGSYEGTAQIDPSSGWMLHKNVAMRCSGEVTMPPNEEMPQAMTMPVTMETIITVEPME